ncbi:MAG: hypothetical protein A2V77_18195 [Anaeromyxobacter sp. RBG_16_69_14]|nr:MAG: hypothetical protein A2V77_18195 [Anaeromyxobacter sp. RBG_16_69_14]
MSEVKMGTNYVREIAENFRKAAADCKYPDIKGKLVALAGEMELHAGKLFFKTQKGTEDMSALAAKHASFAAKLAACADEASAQSYATPILTEISAILEHVKTMKVRMT